MRPICIALELGAIRHTYVLVDHRAAGPDGRPSSIRIVRTETPPLLRTTTPAEKR